MTVKFQLGRIVATPGALDLEEKVGDPQLLAKLLRRHIKGDWGDLCAEDKNLNDNATQNGTRIFSSYETSAGKVWIITEGDRSATTFLLPGDY